MSCPMEFIMKSFYAKILGQCPGACQDHPLKAPLPLLFSSFLASIPCHLFAPLGAECLIRSIMSTRMSLITLRE